ncbi:hypothetical protein CLU79DRAFT_847786 [Phycomyces nitens]|nr:hypothetical protein CLU79DRAFT_847786 [Phycomyces nitens]
MAKRKSQADPEQRRKSKRGTTKKQSSDKDSEYPAGVIKVSKHLASVVVRKENPNPEQAGKKLKKHLKARSLHVDQHSRICSKEQKRWTM